jgi:hypothetical protein
VLNHPFGQTVTQGIQAYAITAKTLTAQNHADRSEARNVVAGDFETRDEQANIIRAEISKVIAVRAVYYLQSGKRYLHGSNQNTGGGFHALSEGYGFIYSLQFTRVPNSDSPYFTPAEVTTILDKLMGDGENGLWDVTPETLDQLSDQIADAFEFTVQEATE